MPDASIATPDLDETLLCRHRRAIADCRRALAEFGVASQRSGGVISRAHRRQALATLSEVTDVMAEMKARQEEIKQLLARATRQAGAASAYARIKMIMGSGRQNIRH